MPELDSFSQSLKKEVEIAHRRHQNEDENNIENSLSESDENPSFTSIADSNDVNNNNDPTNTVEYRNANIFTNDYDENKEVLFFPSLNSLTK